MNFLDKARRQKFLPTSLLLFTLSIGILIGTLVNTGVRAEKGQAAAPDASPLVIPSPTKMTNDFTKLAQLLEPSVVYITTDYIPKQETAARKRRPQVEDEEDDDGDLLRRFFGAPRQGMPNPRAFRREASGGTVRRRSAGVGRRRKSGKWRIVRGMSALSMLSPSRISIPS